MSLRWGFKAEANRISLRFRRDLGLAPYAPIDLFSLAERLGAHVVPLSAFADECSDAVRHLTHVESSAFSAATVPLPNNRRVIIFNDSHEQAVATAILRTKSPIWRSGTSSHSRST